MKGSTRHCSVKSKVTNISSSCYDVVILRVRSPPFPNRQCPRSSNRGKQLLYSSIVRFTILSTGQWVSNTCNVYIISDVLHFRISKIVMSYLHSLKLVTSRNDPVLGCSSPTPTAMKIEINSRKTRLLPPRRPPKLAIAGTNLIVSEIQHNAKKDVLSTNHCKGLKGRGTKINASIYLASWAVWDHTSAWEWPFIRTWNVRNKPCVQCHSSRLPATLFLVSPSGFRDRYYFVRAICSAMCDATYGYCHKWWTWCNRPTCENHAPTGAVNFRRASIPLRLHEAQVTPTLF